MDVEYSDFSIRELIAMVERRELHAAPIYQRKFRWDEVAESRLVESILLGLPVPSIFVATNEDYTWEIVDGLQRLSTLIHFVSEDHDLLTMIGKTTPLKIKGLEGLSEMNGKRFADLNRELQLYFGRRALRVTALSDKSDKNVRFDLFERLNRGAVALTAQEVRSCVHQGLFNNLLEQLASDERTRRLIKLQSSHENDGTREELALKFFAYLHNRGAFRGKVTEFLNDFMADGAPQLDPQASEDLFFAAVEHALRATGGGPLLRPRVAVTPQNQLEAVLVGIAEVIRGGKEPRVPSPGWQEDPELVAGSTGATNTANKLRQRVDRAVALFSPEGDDA
ncbi:MAG: DUF262 domain-containing protein [Actinomycetota bacterium]